MKQINKAIELLEEAMELLEEKISKIEEKMEKIEEKASYRESGEMTERERERFSELEELRFDLQCEIDEIYNAIDYVRPFEE
jgi:prefoldin subunit 5